MEQSKPTHTKREHLNTFSSKKFWEMSMENGLFIFCFFFLLLLLEFSSTLHSPTEKYGSVKTLPFRLAAQDIKCARIFCPSANSPPRKFVLNCLLKIMKWNLWQKTTLLFRNLSHPNFRNWSCSISGTEPTTKDHPLLTLLFLHLGLRRHVSWIWVLEDRFPGSGS